MVIFSRELTLLLPDELFSHSADPFLSCFFFPGLLKGRVCANLISSDESLLPLSCSGLFWSGISCSCLVCPAAPGSGPAIACFFITSNFLSGVLSRDEAADGS